MEEARERKTSKYEELVNTCKDKGWRPWLFPIEIGTRGFVAKAAFHAMSQLGLTSLEKRNMLREAGDQAERSSNWLWLKRKESNWSR